MENIIKKTCFLCSTTIYKNSNISLHKFPSDIDTRLLWLKACGLSENKFMPNLLICSTHFKKNSFESFPMKVLKPNAIPTKFTKISKQLNQLQTHIDHTQIISNIHSDDNRIIQSCSYTSTTHNQPIMDNIKHIIESSKVPIVFNNMLDDWEPFKWNLEKWNNLFEDQPLDCRKGLITCTKEPLWENKCSHENHLFSEIIEMSKNVENNGKWLYFDYKYIGEKVNEEIFKSISWKKFGYESLTSKDSTLWIGSIGAHTPCHQDLYGINLVAQVHGEKRWILMPPEMGKYLKPSRIPYEESSCYSKINFSCPDNIKDIDKNCKCVSVVLSPGDVLLVPHKWWHYVENITTAISINTWIPIPKYDNMARLNESVVRFMASSICNGVSENIRSQLLNPNEIYSSSMTTESINFISQSIKMIEQEKYNFNSIGPDSTLKKKCMFKTYEPKQSLYKMEFDTSYHRKHHKLSSSNQDTNVDISHKLLDAICNENVINLIVDNLINNSKLT